jgi:hypothetical protein
MPGYSRQQQQQQQRSMTHCMRSDAQTEGAKHAAAKHAPENPTTPTFLAAHLGGEGAVGVRSVDLQLHSCVVARRCLRDVREACCQELRHDVGKQRLHGGLPLDREGRDAGSGDLRWQHAAACRKLVRQPGGCSSIVVCVNSSHNQWLHDLHTAACERGSMAPGAQGPANGASAGILERRTHRQFSAEAGARPDVVLWWQPCSNCEVVPGKRDYQRQEVGL